MTESDDRVSADSGEAGNYVDPVDLGKDSDHEVVLGSDPATDKGDFTTSTDHGDGRDAPPNVTRADGEYTETEANPDEAAGEGEYTDRDEA